MFQCHTVSEIRHWLSFRMIWVCLITNIWKGILNVEKKNFWMMNFWNSVTQKHFWNLIAVLLLNVHSKKHIRLRKAAVTLLRCVQIYQMTHQTKLTDIVNPNKLENCELKQWTDQNKSFLSIPFLGHPVESQKTAKKCRFCAIEMKSHLLCGAH